MKQWICIEDGEFHASRKVTKGEILWVYSNSSENSVHHIHENGLYALGLPSHLFKKHFITLSEYREKQLEEILK